jgi:predicted nucleotidyltransferase
MMTGDSQRSTPGRWQRLAAHLAKVDGVAAVYLFGSEARGDADHLSDVDLAVLLRRDLRKGEMWRLEDQLTVTASDLLETSDLDLFVINLAPLAAQFEIISAGRLLLSNDEAWRTDFEVTLMAEWWDFQEYEALFDRYLLERIKEGFGDAEQEQYSAALGASG